jgi:Mg2+ and Co2+ transporter CorA
VYWSMKLGSKEFAALQSQPRNLGVAALSIIAAEWLTVVQYLTTRLNQIEWELQHPDFRTPPYGLDASLRRLHPWRRSLPVYEQWVQEVLDDMLSDDALSKDQWHSGELLKLRGDFIAVRKALRTKQTQVQDMVSVVTAIISIEENKRSAEQNHNVTRLTYLAVLFVPMTFVSGFLSMTPDVTALSRTFWIYFALALPLTFVALVIAQWVYISVWARSQWKAYSEKVKAGKKKKT